MSGYIFIYTPHTDNRLKEKSTRYNDPLQRSTGAAARAIEKLPELMPVKRRYKWQGVLREKLREL